MTASVTGSSVYVTYRNHQIAQAIDDGGCAGVDDHRRIGLLDDRRPREPRSSPERSPVEEPGIGPAAFEADLPRTARPGRLGPADRGSKGCQIDRSAPPDHGGAQVHEYRCHLRQFDVKPRLVALQKIGQHHPGIKTRRGHRHPEYMALTAKQQIDFTANYDFGEWYSVLVEKPSSRRGQIGEAAVDLCGRRIGERLADTLDKIVPHWREHAAQTRGDAGKPRHQHGRKAEFSGDFDSMQWTGAANGEQREVARIVPRLDRHQADRMRQLIRGDGP